jgi:hypothetical protein
MLTSLVVPIGWSIISGITGRFHRNLQCVSGVGGGGNGEG